MCTSQYVLLEMPSLPKLIGIVDSARTMSYERGGTVTAHVVWFRRGPPGRGVVDGIRYRSLFACAGAASDAMCDDGPAHRHVAELRSCCK